MGKQRRVLQLLFMEPDFLQQQIIKLSLDSIMKMTQMRCLLWAMERSMHRKTPLLLITKRLFFMENRLQHLVIFQKFLQRLVHLQMILVTLVLVSPMGKLVERCLTIPLTTKLQVPLLMQKDLKLKQQMIIHMQKVLKL